MHLPRLPARPLAALLFALLAIAGVLARAQSDDSDDRRSVHVLHFEGAVTPVVASYLADALDAAEAAGAELAVIRLDTPGGSVEVTDDITRRMQSSEIPVVVWVGPRGAMAASAGTFVTLAGHVAAMAPGTSIGAASPVGQQGEDLPETARSKTVNMLVTRVRNLAERRGIQAQDWAESAVRDAISATAEEAQRLNVVDLLAADLDDLLRQLDGRPVNVGSRTVALRTTGAEIVDVPMGAVDRVLHTLASPNLAYILMTLGMMGLIYEFSNPGFGLGGVVGGICLLLGVYALGVLPATYTGVALMLLAFALFFAGVELGTNGLIAMGGVVALIAGGVLLFDAPEVAVSPSVLVTVAACCGAFFLFAARMALRAQRRTATTGREGLVGAVGIARTGLEPEGIVVVWGENWRATAAGGTVAKGAAIEVEAVDGLRVRVRAAGGGPESGEVSPC